MRIIQLAERYDIQDIAFDRFNSSQLVDELQNEEWPIPVWTGFCLYERPD